MAKKKTKDKKRAKRGSTDKPKARITEDVSVIHSDIPDPSDG